MTSTSPRTSGKRKRWLLRLVVPFAGALVVVCVASLVTLLFGGVSGEEFCPQTFERRSFHYLEIPLLRWQVRKVVRKDITGKTEDFLRTEKVIPRKASKPTWHIVRGMRRMRQWTGDAQILVNYFNAEDANGNPVWLDWSSDHPKLAAILWPAVSRLAVEELYIYVPDLIELARQARDPVQFRKQIDHRVAQTFFAAGQRCQESGNHEAALHYLDQALATERDNPTYLEARAKSHEELGHKKEAEADWSAFSKHKKAEKEP